MKIKRNSKLDALKAEASIVVAKGTCPTCGTKLYRNLSLTGWWQCGHYGSPGFQKEAGPHCDWQAFTE